MALSATGCKLFGPREPKRPPRDLVEELQGLERPERAPQGALVHIVKKGETIYSIARMYGVRPGDIMKVNDIYNPSYIAVGQSLVIPGKMQQPTLPGRAAPDPDFSGITSERNFVWPLQGRIVTHYDEDGRGLEHRAITISGLTGNKVVAAKSGIVIFASEALRGYGKVVVIQHSDGFVTFYGYLSKILVRQFQEVRQGQVIGEVGETGRVDTPQLYFRMLYREQPVNPVQYLP